MARRLPRWVRVAGGALGVLILTLFFGGQYLSVARTAGAEEHFRLGQNLHATGVLSLMSDAPAVFRPPGFPAFVSAVLDLRDLVAPRLTQRRAVALGHACLLSLGALLLFLHAARDRPVPVAFAVGALYAFHPLSLALARALSYPTLHVVLITAATLALTCALRSPRRRMPWALAAGALWGTATLVRPLSLILPPFVLVLARWEGGKGGWRGALRFTCLFTLGMGLVVGPYTLRNYRLSHHVILVNAQEGHSLWGLSATKNPRGDIDEWMAVWNEQGLAIFTRASGGAGFSTAALHENAVAVNDALRAEAFRNIRRDPSRFARNVLSNFYQFNADSTCWWIDYVREGDVRPGADPAKVFTVVLLLLGLFGVVRGLRDGETHARVVATIYGMFCVAHSLGFLLARYNYVRLPLVLLALPLALPRPQWARRPPLALDDTRGRLVLVLRQRTLATAS